MSVNAQNFVYCPICAKTLEVRTEEERQIKICLGCNEKYYPKHDIAVAGIVVKYNTFSYLGPHFETLMVLRNREPRKGLWSFPAGFVNFGEHPDDALAREISEEIGLSIVRSKLIEEVVSDDDPRSPKQQSKFYQIVVTGKIKNRDKEENTQIVWWILDSVNPNPPIAWENHKRLFEKIKTGQIPYTGLNTHWLSDIR